MSKLDESDTNDEINSLDPLAEPPIDRFCDVVMDGGVINGVVYPGFLIELARKFRFSSIGGTSVGAIAGSLAAACEYSRRFGSLTGFNDGLRKLPQELAEYVDDNQTTRIRSLFQPDPSVSRLFDFFVDLLGKRVQRGEIQVFPKEPNESENQLPLHLPNLATFLLDAWLKACLHLGPKSWGLLVWTIVTLILTYVLFGLSSWFLNGDGIELFQPTKQFVALCMTWAVLYFFSCTVLHPILMAHRQLKALFRLQGFGACSGLSVDGVRPALTDWLYDGVQKAAKLPYGNPLCFRDLWDAPGGPNSEHRKRRAHSIELKMMSTCLSHGRAYELPTLQASEHLMFRLSEFKAFFPAPVINHLRLVSKKLTVDTDFVQNILFKRSVEVWMDPLMEPDDLNSKLEKLSQREDWLHEQFILPEPGFKDPDIRILPAGDLPIVVAARMSMSCPVLFQSIPMLGLNFDRDAENINLVRLWFSDGGISSNFPIHLFDKALPKWPTFGIKILDASSRVRKGGKPRESHVPYFHADGANDVLIDPLDASAFTTFLGLKDFRSFMQFAMGVYVSAKDGHDKSHMPMPDVRNRVVNLYLNQRSGGGLNLMISSQMIIKLGVMYGANAGQNIANAYLGQIKNEKYGPWVNAWNDHRWVRLNLLIQGLRKYLDGFGYAVQHGSLHNEGESLDWQDLTNSNKPLGSLFEQVDAAELHPPLRWFAPTETTLTPEQAQQMRDLIALIAKLEQDLKKIQVVLPYSPQPEPVLRFQPRL